MEWRCNHAVAWTAKEVIRWRTGEYVTVGLLWWIADVARFTTKGEIGASGQRSVRSSWRRAERDSEARRDGECCLWRSNRDSSWGHCRRLLSDGLNDG